MKFIDTPTRHTLPKRLKPPAAIVLHTTGETDLDKIVDWYTDKLGNNTDAVAPHYMISVLGSVRRIVPEDRVAYHCKIAPEEAYLYRLGYDVWSTWLWREGRPPVRSGQEYSGYVQWRDNWRARGLQSPLELVTGARPNTASVGIEIQQPVSPSPDVFTDEQYDALAELLVDLWVRLRIPLDREHVLGHYDCSPMRRCDKRGSTDPGRNFNYPRLWDLVRARVA